MRKVVSFIVALCASGAWAQSHPEFSLPFGEPAARIKFLASDELGGRMTGEHGNAVAARYIASQFLRYGVQPLAPNYYQPVPLVKRSAPSRLTFKIGDKAFPSEELLLLSGEAFAASAPVVYAGFGVVDSATGRDDYKGIDARGKIVVTRLGTSERDSPRELFGAFKQKQEAAKAKGALALVELYRFAFPLSRLKAFLGGATFSLDDGSSERSSFPHLLLSDEESTIRALLESNKKLSGRLETDGYREQKVVSHNVVGMIEGADSTLKNEHVLLSAHYDHIGINPTPNSEDSIYNGARDNAMGVTALLCAARAFSESPPKRSLILLACAGEEIGLLGSQYYAEHPLVPLNKVVFNLNVDGAGYNDTSAVTIIGLERTTAEQDLIEACNAFGLKAIQDPAPEQSLFDRSDNVSFAKKGVPAPTFSPGFRAFDDAINKYYHQPSDQADEHFDFAYLHRFVKAFIYAARRIADSPNAPRWQSGDKYEAASQTLYGR